MHLQLLPNSPWQHLQLLPNPPWQHLQQRSSNSNCCFRVAYDIIQCYAMLKGLIPCLSLCFSSSLLSFFLFLVFYKLFCMYTLDGLDILGKFFGSLSSCCINLLYIYIYIYSRLIQQLLKEPKNLPKMSKPSSVYMQNNL
jgi:hypothetical protein